jgi:DNA-binding transcriptional LysR family regulator
MTEAGERCYPHCRRLLDAAGAAADSLAQARDAPAGELRVAAPVGFAAHIAPALASLLAQSPKLRLRLFVDDAMIDLIEARIDIAVRVGRLPNSSWIARRLGELEVILCAAPAYLERHGVPASPQDLAGHHWLAFARDTIDASAADTTPTAERMPSLVLDLLDATGEHQRVNVGVRIESNNQLALQQMCEQGLGFARLAHADVLPSLTRGSLVRLLPQWTFTPVPVTAVTQRREGEPAKVRLALEALKRYFAKLPGIATP